MEKYNGWTNYATWRINLEMIDGCDPEMFNISEEATAYDVGQNMKEICTDIVIDGKDGLAVDYALAFMSYVNWTEIAAGMIEQYREEQAA